MSGIREEFEDWIWSAYGEQIWWDMNRDDVLKRDGDEYYGNFLNERWEAWQASRAALKVELPDGDPGEVGPRKFVIEEVKEALQQAGIEVK